jgi:predicted ArsR family transcriptional regulator
VAKSVNLLILAALFPNTLREMSEPAAVRRALADEHRILIVDELRRSRGGLDARELAHRLGLHANTVRWHLGVLDDAELLDAAPAPNGRPGRPRMLYRLRPGASAASRGDEHRLLATILTAAVAALADGEERAREAGRAWGRFLVRRPSPLQRMGEDEAVAEVARLLDEEGFEAEPHGKQIHMHRCPFHDLAEANTDIVCGIHLGLMAGAFEELGGDLQVEGLDVFVRPDLCVARMRPRRPVGLRDS